MITCLRVRLDVEPSAIAGLHDELSGDERERAARYVFDRDRRRFIVGRGALRRILAGLLDAEPSEIAFAYGPHGKPEIVSSRLRFNVSHSVDLMCVAIGFECEIGIDIEAIRDDTDVLALATYAFADRDAHRLRALPPPARGRAFYEMWTRTEAILKCAGRGVGDIGRTSAFAASERAVNFHLIDGYAAALAVSGDVQTFLVEDRDATS